MSLFDWFKRIPRRTTSELLEEARRLAADGRPEAAGKVYGAIPARDRTPAILAEMARNCLALRQTPLALGYALDALALDPGCGEAKCIQGEVLLLEHRPGEAEERFREALRLDPGCESARRGLAAVRRGKDPPPRAAPPPPPPAPSRDQRRGEPPPPSAAVVETVRQLHNTATLLNEQYQFRRALAAAEEALRLAEGRLGAAHPLVARCLNCAAIAHQGLGDYLRAEKLLERAIDIQASALPRDHPDLGRSLDNLAGVYCALQDFQRAEPLRRRAVAIARAVNDPNELAVTLNNLAYLCESLKKPDESEALYKEAAAVLARHGATTHPDMALALHGLATVYHGLGRHAEAESLYTRALGIWRDTGGLAHPQGALTVNNLAELYRARGDHQRAYEMLREALASVRPRVGDGSSYLIPYLVNLALSCAGTGRVDEALALLLEATRIEDRAIAQVLATRPEADQLSYLATIRNHVDCVLSLLCDHGPRSAAAVLSGFELVLRRKGLLAEVSSARRSAVRKWANPELIGQRTELEDVRTRLATGSLETFPAAEADDLVRKQEQFEVLTRKLDEKYRPVLTRYAEIVGAGLDVPEDLEADLAARQNDLVAAGMQAFGDKATFFKYFDLMGLALDKQFQEKLEHEVGRRTAQAVTESLNRLRRIDARAVAAALPEGSALIEFVRIDHVDFRPGYPARPARTAAGSPGRYVAFVLPARRPESLRLIDLGDAGRLERLIAAFRSVVAVHPGRRRDLGVLPAEPAPPGDPGGELSTAVLGKVLPALNGARRLFVASDGDLALLPFETLSDGGRFLIDEYRITYLSTGKDVLRFSQPRVAEPAPAVVIADPDFDLAGAEGPAPSRPATPPAGAPRLDRLPGTEQEGRAVASLLGVRPWLGAEALKGPLTRCRAPWILHFATHGLFLAEEDRDPRGVGWVVRPGWGRLSGVRIIGPLLRSGVALAGAGAFLAGKPVPADAGNGLLTGEEVLGLDLEGTELVVLSACDTGRGETYPGEGVFGLRRAALLAGTRTLVTSLWKVPDEQTRDLMVAFYKGLLAGRPRDAALRGAQRMVKEMFPDPFYWGAFVCTGDPGPLPDRPGQSQAVPARGRAPARSARRGRRKR